MPFLSSNRAYGDLVIQPRECEITIEDDDSTSFTFTLGSIKYSSRNSYFLDQSFIFENGAIILSQSKDDLIVIKPNFIIDDEDGFIFNLIKISDIGGISSASGYKTYPLQTRYQESPHEKVELNIVTNLTVKSTYKSAWEKFFNNTLDTDVYDYIVEDTDDGDGLVIRFSEDADFYPSITVRIYEIDVQISPGWTT
jgi:hypothetical protein